MGSGGMVSDGVWGTWRCMGTAWAWHELGFFAVFHMLLCGAIAEYVMLVEGNAPS